MSNYTYADLFDKSASKKEITIETEDKSVKITNSEIHFEQFELKEILCDDEYLTFGQCNASQLKFKISNVFTSMIGKKINVSAVINGRADTPFIFGKYRVISDKPTDDKRYRNVTAYDAIYDIGEAEVSPWYNGLKFPLKLKQFRDSFFAYFGVEQVETTLPNDNMEVAETIKPSELSGQTVMEAICGINGCFGHINNDGKFEYIFLKEIIPGLYPNNGLYPQKGLYPRDGNIKEKVKGGKYKTVKYEDFVCQKITKVQIRQSENDIGAVYPDTEITDNDNSYILQDNFLVYGMSADALETVARNLYGVIKVINYRPYNCDKIGNPCLKLGEAIKIYTKYVDIESYVLSRTYKGIQQPIDTISAIGKAPKYSEQVNGINKSIIQLRGKTNELERNVEETRSEIKDVENGLDTKITQTAERIESNASKTYETKESATEKLNTAKGYADAAESNAKKDTADKLKSYSTTVEMNSAIKQSAENITLAVNKTAKGYADTAESNAKADTADKVSAEQKRAIGVETDLSAAISVQADQIKLKVSQGDVSNQLSIEEGQISISGNRFVLEADNCSISADGTITSQNAIMTGSFKSIGEDGSYTEVTSGAINFYSETLQNTGKIKGEGKYLTIDAISLNVTGQLLAGEGATWNSSYIKSLSKTTKIASYTSVVSDVTLSVTKDYKTGNVSAVSLTKQTKNVTDSLGYGTQIVTDVSTTGGNIKAFAGIVTNFT